MFSADKQVNLKHVDILTQFYYNLHRTNEALDETTLLRRTNVEYIQCLFCNYMPIQSLNTVQPYQA